MKLLRLSPIILLLASLAGCFTPGSGLGLGDLRFPGVFKATIQQGNVVTQDMVDQLEPGMSPRQVRYIMGKPILDNSFRSDRWDYVYTIQIGNFERRQHRLTLYFEDDALVGFEGDFLPTPIKEAMDAVEAAEAAEAESR